MKAAEAIIQISELEEPPFRLLLGKIAYNVAKKKFSSLLKDIETWKVTSISADYQE